MIRKMNGPMVVLRHVGRPMGGGKGRGLIKPRPRKALPIGLFVWVGGGVAGSGNAHLRLRPLACVWITLEGAGLFEAPPTRGFARWPPLMHGRWGWGSSGHAHLKFSPFVPMEGRQEAGLCEATPFWEERLRPVSP